MSNKDNPFVIQKLSSTPSVNEGCMFTTKCISKACCLRKKSWWSAMVHWKMYGCRNPVCVMSHWICGFTIWQLCSLAKWTGRSSLKLFTTKNQQYPWRNYQEKPPPKVLCWQRKHQRHYLDVPLGGLAVKIRTIQPTQATQRKAHPAPKAIIKMGFPYKSYGKRL